MGTARLLVSESGLWPPWGALGWERGAAALMAAPDMERGKAEASSSKQVQEKQIRQGPDRSGPCRGCQFDTARHLSALRGRNWQDRKSTRLNSSHLGIS